VLLRHWREVRGKNQLELSLDTGVSQRHLSFIENRRSAPSRKILMDIAQALDIPFRDRNELLLAAGYAPTYSETAWNTQEMESITKALGRVLRQHEPFPALVMDRYWNVLTTKCENRVEIPQGCQWHASYTRHAYDTHRLSQR
jgi:transcriptional regulator with XRE-family HTH domain